MSEPYDLAVIGAGIVGLAHALAAARRGLKVVVLERDARANGASIRNFGFVTVTGQQAGECWRRARRTRDVWAEIAPQAGIEVVQQGLVVAARYAESEAVIDAYLATEAGAECRRIGLHEARALIPDLSAEVRCALHSPVELRVESRDAIPQLATWLARSLGVEFRYGTAVQRVEGTDLVTARGAVRAHKVVACPGDDLVGLFPDRLAAYGLTRCKLHMMRVMPGGRPALGTALMSDLGLARYAGYAELPEARDLKIRLDAERADARANGVHLIVVQSQDGSLVVGDSHHYAPTPDPFAPQSVDRLIFEEFDAVLPLGGYRVVERWTGTYASAEDRLALIDRPDKDTRLVVVTSGTGASTGFAIGEEVVAELFGTEGEG